MGFLRQHLSPALSRSEEKGQWTSICHYITVAALVTTDEMGDWTTKLGDWITKQVGKHRGDGEEMTEECRRRWRGRVKGSDTASRLKGNKRKQPRLWMLFYQVHCVARFFPTLQNTLLHQAEHGKLPRINTPPLSVSLIFYCWLHRYSSLAVRHLNATSRACADGKKWPKTGSKVEFVF